LSLVPSSVLICSCLFCAMPGALSLLGVPTLAIHRSGRQDEVALKPDESPSKPHRGTVTRPAWSLSSPITAAPG